MDEQIRSIQALGERRNYRASENLLQLLKQQQTPRLIRKNIILSLGYIHSEYYLQDIFKQIDFNDQITQLATLHALSQYKSIQVQAFFFNLLFTQRLKSFSAKVHLIHMIVQQFGKKIIPILMFGLQNKNQRIVANTIEVIGEIKSKSNITLFLPYLESPYNRTRAQAIIALYRYHTVRKQCLIALYKLFLSKKRRQINSALYIIGKLKLKAFKMHVVPLLTSSDQDIQRNATFCLIQLDYEPAYNQLFTLLLNSETAAACMHPFVTLSPLHRTWSIEKMHDLTLDERNSIIALFESSSFDLTEEIQDLKTD